MPRSVVATAKRTLRRAATWRPKYDGWEQLDIAELISPFRYDVIVRAQLFDAIAARPQGQSDRDFVRSVSDHPYAMWFREVELRRFFPWILKDPSEVEKAYADRVVRAVRTLHSFDAQGFDARHPIILRRLPRPVGSDSGVLSPKLLHLGDGGHRLALLYRAGLPLEPWMHRVDPRPTKVIDNTAVLAPRLGLDEPTYTNFVARAFVHEPVRSLAHLRALVSQFRPSRVDELEALIAAHSMEVASR